MTDRDLPLEAPVTAEEAEAAGRLAAALGSRGPVDADREALAVVQLLQSVSSAAGSDEVATRRLRNELVCAPERRRAWRRVAVAAALACAVAGGALLWRSAGPPGQARLAARERAARTAVAAVIPAWDTDEAAARRVASSLDRAWRVRLADRLEGERFAALARTDATLLPASPLAKPSPTAVNPGGA